MARRRGSGKPKVVVSYADAPDDVRAILKRLIEDEHGFLAQANIGLLMRSGKWSRKGETVMAAVKRPGPENRHYHALDYVLIINAEFWNAVPERSREAIIDEQLCLCNLDEKTGKFGIQAPDVTANNSNVRRYGAWKHSIKAMQDALKEGAVKHIQTELQVDEPGQSENDPPENENGGQVSDDGDGLLQAVGQ